jgi:hypothetical protein
MIEGVLRHDTEMEVERQYVDTRTPLLQTNAYAMTARHALAAGIATKVGSHSFRATGITSAFVTSKRDGPEKYHRRKGQPAVAEGVDSARSIRGVGELMPVYQICPVNADKMFAPGCNVTCKNDGEAVALARKMMEGSAEAWVWEGPRFLGIVLADEGIPLGERTIPPSPDHARSAPPRIICRRGEPRP